ncbi:MAG: YhcH/YjgK/YiaL family protein [Firmicutes bacterium]|nr:YhcH/YjgK/YiaL family protein [Bacillota bacterium]
MVLGNINDCQKYFIISSDIKNAFEYLKTVEYGKNTTNLTVNFSEPITADEDSMGKKKLFEAHRKYIDLHYIIDGTEKFGYANINTLKPVTEYNEKDDYILLSGEASRITLNKGDFVIAFPEDAHIPALKYKNSEKVKRAVVKIPV